MSDVDKAAETISQRGLLAILHTGAGHSIGLEDHEVGDVSLVNDEVIEPGQCFSVELVSNHI